MGSGDGEVAPGYAIDPVRKLLTLRVRVASRITGGGEVRSGAGGGVWQRMRTGRGVVVGILTV